MRLRSALQLALAALTGVLYPFCFPNFDLGWLAWILLVPLHVAIGETPPRRAFWLGWMAGWIGFMGTMSWVVTAMHMYGKMPLLWSYVALALLSAYLGLHVAVYTVTITWLRRTLPPSALLAAPFVWVTLELIRTSLFSGLPWALLGYSQSQWLSAIQIADLTGVYGVSFVIVLVNIAMAESVLWMIRKYRTLPLRQPASTFPWATPAAAFFIFAVTLIYGFIVLRATEMPSPTLTIGLVQANIDQAHKWDATYRQETLDRYARLTGEAADKTDLVIWPEAATPFLFEQELVYRGVVESMVRHYGVPLLFGSPALRYYANGKPYLMNSAYLFAPEGRILGRYDKRHLVPFGEYIPLKSFLFFLDKLVEGIGDFEAGTVPTVLALPAKPDGRTEPALHAPAKFGVVICFEAIFPDLVREFVRDGADFMVTITNDAWFGNSAAPYQHFGMVVLRAVENHIAFARAANTGISGFIDPYGRVLNASPIFTEQAMIGRIPVHNTPTFYSRHGDVFAYGCVIITGLFLLAALWRTGGSVQQPLVVGATT
jgi:apolipoprotein N-acyltransferase